MPGAILGTSSIGGMQDAAHDQMSQVSIRHQPWAGKQAAVKGFKS